MPRSTGDRDPGPSGDSAVTGGPRHGPAIRIADPRARPRPEPDHQDERRAALPVSAEQGFVLLEVIVAFIIAALALVVLYNAGVSGLRATAAAAHYQQAVARARSHLTLAEHASPLVAGSWSGDDGSGYVWHLRVAPIASTTVRPTAATTVSSAANVPLTLYAITVLISWHDADGDTDADPDAARAVQLDTQEIGQGAR